MQSSPQQALSCPRILSGRFLLLFLGSACKAQLNGQEATAELNSLNSRSRLNFLEKSLQWKPHQSIEDFRSSEMSQKVR